VRLAIEYIGPPAHLLEGGTVDSKSSFATQYHRQDFAIPAVGAVLFSGGQFEEVEIKQLAGIDGQGVDARVGCECGMIFH
jgi:hypothetical protein